MVRPGGDPPTRRSSWIASRGRGRRARDRSPVACAPDSSPGPRPWPCRARPPIRGVGVLRSGRGGSMRVGRMHGVHGRPRGSPVRRADRQLLWQCRRRVVHRGLGEGTREPWGPLGPGPCDPGRDSPDRVTMRSRTSPLGDRPPDPRPSRHRMETTTQDSSPKPTINHYLKNPHHSTSRPTTSLSTSSTRSRWTTLPPSSPPRRRAPSRSPRTTASSTGHGRRPRTCSRRTWRRHVATVVSNTQYADYSVDVDWDD